MSGLTLSNTLPRHRDLITRFCWSPNGTHICSPSLDGTFRISDVETGAVLASRRPFDLPDGSPPIPLWKVAWVESAQCRGYLPLIAVASENPSIYLYSAFRREAPDLTFQLEDHQGPVYSLAWTKDGTYLASGGWDCIVRVWGFARNDNDPRSEQWTVHKTFPRPDSAGHTRGVNTLAWSPRDSGKRHLASGSQDGTVRVWDITDDELECIFKVRAGINSVTWSPDGRYIASSAEDGCIYVHSYVDRETIRKIEGHTRSVIRVHFSGHGNLLASKCGDNSVRLWDTNTWCELARIDEQQAPGGRAWHAGTAFDPSRLRLATLGEKDTSIRIWDIDISELLGTAAILPIRHVSAKVALLGKTDIGKSCLVMRLVENRYISDTEIGSTLGMKFSHVDAARFHSSARSARGEHQRITFWDFGGQEFYLLVHELFLDDTTIALVLIDPRRTEDAEQQAKEWNAVLQKHLQPAAIKLLVGAKQDKESFLVNRQVMERLCARYGYDGYFEVSAKTGRGIDDLRAEIASKIPWGRLSSTTRPELFQAIREDVARRQRRGDITLALYDLRSSIREAYPDCYEEDAVDIVIDQLCQQGAIAKSTDVDGNDVLVLQIEVIERFAASLVVAAANNPKGVPALELRQLGLSQHHPWLENSDGLSPDQVRLVTECVVELMINANACFKHHGLLVFPSLFQATEIEDEMPIHYSIPVYYDFIGAIDNIYASAVVQMILGGEFGTARLWRNRVEFDAPGQGVCGIRRIERPNGLARLDLYFAAKTTDERRRLFDRFIDEHLRERGVDVHEYQSISCRSCGETISADIVQANIQLGERDVICAYCRKKTSITEGVADKQTPDREATQKLVALRGKIKDETRVSLADMRREVGIGSDREEFERSIRLLHISDLHFSGCGPSDPETQLRWLIQDLRRDQGQDFPAVEDLEYLVVSGDFTDKGCEEGFDKAYTFIDLLTKEMKLSAQRVILVPGNHDAADLNQSYRLESDEERIRTLASDEFVKKEDIYLVRNEEVYPQRFSMFDAMLYHKLKLTPYPLKLKEQGIPFHFPDKHVQFLTFNSAWQVDQLHRKRSGLNPDAVALCLERARAQEQVATDGRAQLRIAVFHHAITGPEMMGNLDVLTHLQAVGVKLCLHGDVHELRNDILGYQHRETRMFAVGVGSFGAPFTELPPATPRLYNLIELDRSCSGCRVFSRKQNRENTAWEGVFEWTSSEGVRQPYFDIDFCSPDGR